MMLRAFAFVGLLACLLLAGVSVRAEDNKDLTPLTGDDLKMAQEMNAMYAKHIYSVGCMEKQKAYTMPRTGTKEELVEWAKKAQASCDCMGETLTKAVGGNALIDYATTMYGTRPTNPKAKEGEEFTLSPDIKRINDMNRNKESRRKCGFKE